jgi:hypothetical protein
MAQKKRLSADEITAVWIAPETIRAERVQAAVEDGASGQEVADLAAQPAEGEYREWLGEEEVEVEGHGVVLRKQKLGSRLAWVHPQGSDEGYFERVSDDADDYVPVSTPEED